jgi:thiol-disulfide isomerase/thioredoxin
MKKLILLLTISALCSCCIHKRGQVINRFELAPDIFIIDKGMPIKSIAELINFFKDKTVYIDRWATWCSPCLEEFKYKDSLYKFLNANKIEIVYLNSDSDIQDSVLFQFIISHNLRGYHLRLNDSLKKDLTVKKIFIPRIPQYMIIDNKGNVVENNALRPSKGDTLYLQLKKYLYY